MYIAVKVPLLMKETLVSCALSQSHVHCPFLRVRDFLTN